MKKYIFTLEIRVCCVATLSSNLFGSVEIRFSLFYERNPEIKLVDLRRDRLTTSWLIKFSNDELTEVACPKTETLNHLCKSLENIKLIDKKELSKKMFRN